ncbi:MAG: ABC transporter permease [Opitutaceae bacterium]
MRRRTTWLLLGPCLVWLAVLFVVPLLIIVVVSFLGKGSPIEWRMDGSAYARLFNPVYWGILMRSIEVGLVTTVSCLILGFPLAYFLVRQPPRRRQFLYVLVLIPMAANSLVLIYAWITLLRPTGLLEQFLVFLGLHESGPLGILYTPAAVAIGLLYWYLPFRVYPLYNSLERFDFRLLEASADLGAGGLQTFFRVLLPQVVPGLATGCLLVFVQAFCSFVVPDLLGGAKTLMAGNLIQQRFLSLPQDWPLGSALALLIMVILGLTVYVGLRNQREGA